SLFIGPEPAPNMYDALFLQLNKALSFPDINPNASPLQFDALPLGIVLYLSLQFANITTLLICIWKRDSLSSNLDWILHLLQSYSGQLISLFIRVYDNQATEILADDQLHTFVHSLNSCSSLKNLFFVHYLESPFGQAVRIDLPLLSRLHR